MALRLRRGTDAERQTITPQSGELLYVTDTGLVYVGDGTTQGGSLIGGGVELDPNPKLSANLDLNGNSIIGNGNINIDGNITATGNITIGDGVEDNVIVGGTISSGLIPTTDSTFDLGSTAFRWQNGHFTGLFVDGEISANTISLNNIIGPDSSIIYDSLTQSFEGNFKGSLIADDSTILIDGGTGNAILGDIDAESIVSQNIISNSFEGNFKGSLIADRITVDDELKFRIFKGNIDDPLDADDFDRKSIIWSSYNSNTDTFVDNNFIIGYHQSDLSGYLSLTSADSNGDLFKTSIELDGKERKISLIGFENDVDLILDGNERIISTKSNNLVIITENVPTTSVGQVGDKIGMIAVDNDYLYRCVADYDAISDIWTRIAWTSGSW